MILFPAIMALIREQKEEETTAQFLRTFSLSHLILRRRRRMTAFGLQEKAFGAATIFRVVAGTPTVTLASRLPRRERWLLLLLDGRRSVAHLAHLTQRSEFDVASTLAQFLQWRYIEPVPGEQETTSPFEPGDHSA
jgi:hypothetical protein